MAPGGNVELDILLVNNAAETTEFMLLADALTLEDAADRARIQAAENANPGKIADDELLARVRADVTCEGREIYSGTLDGAPAAGADGALYSASGAYLGTIAPRASAFVHVALTVDSALENGYANALCAVSWQFAARSLTGGGENGPGNGNGMNGDGSGGQADITVTADPPKTGDGGNPLLFTLAAGLSLVMLALLSARTAIRRRKNGR
jgi:hypothetical protein